MKKFFSLILLYTLISASVYGQAVVTATGGSGQYKNSIKWLDFSSLGNIPAGGTVVKNFNVGDVVINVKISSISFSGSTNLTTQRLIGYNSGKFEYDGLVKLYNIGVPNNGNTYLDRQKNTLYNAISTLNTGDNVNGFTTKFNIEIYATLNNQPMDLGMIFANAEEDAHQKVFERFGPEYKLNYSEYVKGTTNGTSWQLLEKYTPSTSGANMIEYSNSNKTVKSFMGSDYSSYYEAVGATALMYTKKAATSNTAPLTVNMEMFGGGKTAVALGIVLNTDIGDAPVSYGMPSNIFFADIINGNPSASSGTFTNYLSNQFKNYGTSSNPNNISYGGTPIINVGTLIDPPKSRLGLLGGDNDPHDIASLHSPLANIDDVTNVADEDAFVSLVPVHVSNSSYSVTFKASSTAASGAYIAAWIDFNRNGTFEPGEIQTHTLAANVTDRDVTLTWSNLSALALKSGVSYIRLRVSLFNFLNSDNPSTSIDERSTMALSGGETEDHVIMINSTISGSVFHDANGLQGTPSNTIDGTKISTVNGNIPLYVSLVNATNNTIISTTSVNNGDFSFTGPYEGDYKLVLSTASNGINNAVSTTLPQVWVNTGEYNGTGAGNDALADGNLLITSSGKNITTLKFGIEQKPKANSVMWELGSYYNPVTQKYGPYSSGVKYIVGLEEDTDSFFLNGSDPEDSPADGSIKSGSLATITFTNLPTAANAVLYYNNVVLTNNTTISNFDYNLLTISFTSKNFTYASFNYTLTDRAGKISNTALYTISNSTVLPVTGFVSNVKLSASLVVINWETLSETNVRHFAIEESSDGINFNTIHKVNAANNNSTTINKYQYELPAKSGTWYYRVSAVDIDGKTTQDKVWKIANTKIISLAPNPFQNEINLYTSGIDHQVIVTNATGKTVYMSPKSKEQSFKIATDLWAKGTYYVSVYSNNELIKQFKTVKL